MDTSLLSEEESTIKIEKNVWLDKNSTIISSNNGKIVIGELTKFGTYLNMTCGNGRIVIGRQTTFGIHLYMTCEKAMIQIGEDNMFSSYEKIAVGNHSIYDSEGHNITHKDKIKTGNHIWVGTGVTLLSGTNIGTGSVVGANTMVDGEVPSNVTCAGNPIRVLRREIRWDR